MINRLRGKLQPARQVFHGRAFIGVALVYLSVAALIAQHADRPDTIRNPFSGDVAAIAAGKLLSLIHI